MNRHRLTSGRSRRARLGFVTAALALAAAAAHAQTAIVPDTAPGLSLNTSVTSAPNGMGGTNLDITGGTLRGQNLFHSFHQFDLAAGDRARWTGGGPASGDVRNIVNRVTGGDPSDLFGHIVSTDFPNADFYFLNPAGVIFGGETRVDVPRAFYLSTAEALDFADGARFVATAAANGSTLSMAAPTSFGFITGASGDIRIVPDETPDFRVGGIHAGAGQAVSFSAVKLSFEDPGFSVDGAMVRIAATGAGPASIPVDPLVRLPALGGTLDISGRIFVVGAGQDLRGARAGLAVSAGDIRLYGPAANGREAAIRAASADIVLQAGRIFMSGLSHIGAHGLDQSQPYVLNIEIRDRLEMHGDPLQPNRVQIGTSPFGSELGNSIVRIAGPNAVLDMRGASIDVRVGSSGAAGSIDIDVARFVGEDARLISSSNFPLIAGTGGDIRVHAGEMVLNRTRISSDTFSGGDAGNIDLSGGLLTLLDSSISSGTGSQGKGGSVLVRFADASFVDSSIAASASAAGAAGEIDVQADRLSLLRSRVTSGTSGAGAGGLVSLAGDRLIITDGFLGTDTLSPGAAGRIRISGADVQLLGVQIGSGTSSDGAGGFVSIDGGSVRVVGGLVATASSGAGAAGGMSVTAGDLRLTDTTFRSDSSGTGLGGTITLNAARTIDVLNSTLSSQATGSAAGVGSIELRAGELVTVGMVAGSTRPSLISVTTGSSAPRSAPGGAAIRIEAPVIELRGLAERVDRVAQVPGRVQISASTTGAQDAAAIALVAERELILERADIVAQTTAVAGGPAATGNAGDISFAGGDVTVRNTIVEATNNQNRDFAAGSTGRAGSISVAAVRDLTIADRSVLSSASSGPGPAGSIRLAFGRDGAITGLSRVDTDVGRNGTQGGNIRIDAPAGTLLIRDADPANPDFNRSAVSSSTGNSASGGSITVTVDRLELRDGGGLFAVATTAASGRGGDVQVTAREFLATGPLSGIQATALGSGAAGSILVRTAGMTLADGAEISTNAIIASAGSISIEMPRSAILTLDGRNRPVSITTSSGPGTGGRITIASPLAIISDGGSILALGEARGANVFIDSDFFIRSSDRLNALSVAGDLLLDSDVNDVSQGTEELGFEIVDAFDILISQCASARAGGQVSQLAVRSSGPFPANRLTGNRACVGPPPPNPAQ